MPFKTVSIPQAVSTVATNDISVLFYRRYIVSIPQAVSTVATYADNFTVMVPMEKEFQYRKR